LEGAKEGFNNISTFGSLLVAFERCLNYDEPL